MLVPGSERSRPRAGFIRGSDRFEAVCARDAETVQQERRRITSLQRDNAAYAAREGRRAAPYRMIKAVHALIRLSRLNLALILPGKKKDLLGVTSNLDLGRGRRADASGREVRGGESKWFR